MNPGHAVTFTKGNERKGIPKKPILPTKQEVAILRRAAAGYVKLTFIDGVPRYSYDDGTPLPLHVSRKDPHSQQHFQRLVFNGWLIGDRNDSLFNAGPPQIYRARKPGGNS